MALAVCFLSAPAFAANIDVGFTLGTVIYNGTSLDGQLIKVGTFTGYNDTLGLGWFSGKNQSTLLSSFNSFSLQSGSSEFFGTQEASLYYGSFDTGTTAVGTRIFAWIYSGSTTASAAWAVLSGTIGGSGDFNTSWLAVAPDSPVPNVITASAVNTVVYSSTPSGASMEAFGADPGANLVLVPEPSTGALMMIGAAGLVALRRLRKV